MNVSWLQVAQNIVTFISSGFGIALITIAVSIAGARAMLHGHWGQFWSAIGGGAVLAGAAWVGQTFL
jgi:hypothetical protein